MILQQFNHCKCRPNHIIIRPFIFTQDTTYIFLSHYDQDCRACRQQLTQIRSLFDPYHQPAPRTDTAASGLLLF